MLCPHTQPALSISQALNVELAQEAMSCHTDEMIAADHQMKIVHRLSADACARGIAILVIMSGLSLVLAWHIVPSTSLEAVRNNLDRLRQRHDRAGKVLSSVALGLELTMSM